MEAIGNARYPLFGESSDFEEELQNSLQTQRVELEPAPKLPTRASDVLEPLLEGQIVDGRSRHGALQTSIYGSEDLRHPDFTASSKTCPLGSTTDGTADADKQFQHFCRPDSGSEDNIMIAGLAKFLDLDVDTAPEFKKTFKVANGNAVTAHGRTMVNCSFIKDPSVELRCCFYIFQQLISPVIMGMAFLDETETLAKHRYRLQPRGIPTSIPYQVCSLNYPRCRLYCLADAEPKLANADTGSEVDLMSRAYVERRGFDIQELNSPGSMVQFADGSVASLVGKVYVGINIGTEKSTKYWRVFHVLDGLTCDILLGEDFLNDTAAFESYANAFALDDDGDTVCEVNTIVWFNTVETKLSRIFSRSGTPVSFTSAENRHLEEVGTMEKVKAKVDRLFKHRRSVEKDPIILEGEIQSGS
ncbi:MAG: hypothetical protein Q9167_007216 [Letrouitia subvulpina]